MGKVSVSLTLPEIFQCRVLSACADIDLNIDIIKGNILIEKLRCVLEFKLSGK